MLLKILSFLLLLLPIDCIAMDQNSEYILATGSYGAIQLDINHEIFKEESFVRLKEAGLTKKMIVWDVGCGSGKMTEYLAKEVGSQGLVYAIDSSEAQIEIVKKRIKAAGYKNVKFIVEDINNIDKTKYKKADLVYSRFLLLHVQNPEKVIDIMASLLKPHGVLSLQESTYASLPENNRNPYMNKWHNLITAYARLKGVDFNIGRKLPEICDKLNIFSKVKYYSKLYNTTDQMKDLLFQRFDEVETKIIATNLITKKDYAKLKIGLINYLKSKKSNNSPILAEQSYVIAYK